jgi:hypothetical protein
MDDGGWRERGRWEVGGEREGMVVVIEKEEMPRAKLI